ncbi:uncharacterized protein LOC143462234 isoform X1 [Clavelina lepadiformis]|uniref:uncharacterized protein LOC143462234 isoform X1 n=1 Tax=Clavelina lepadiformis TaxID=159417 RepID=UPI0040427097
MNALVESSSSREAGNLPNVDLESLILENVKKEKLLQHMVEQQTQLKSLQERQKALLQAQQHFAKLDFLTNSDLKAKLSTLQSVRGRIAQLQDMVDNADSNSQLALPPPPPPPPDRYEEDDSILESEKSGFFMNPALDPVAVNDQLEQLYDTVSNLLSDIDNMNVLTASLNKQDKPAYSGTQRSDGTPKRAQVSNPRRHPGVPVSPLPYVNLVEKEREESPRRAKSSPRLGDDDGARDVNFVERHFKESVEDRDSSKMSSDESSLSESYALAKPTAELWKEMRYYQTKLAELKDKREELAALMKQATSNNDADKSNDTSFISTDTRESDSATPKATDEVNEIPMRYLLGRLKNETFDATTEKTNATWGGSTSTSGDENEGFILKPVLKSTEDIIAKGDVGISASVEDHVYELWEALDYHNNFLHILFDDQKALTILLQNTLSVQNDQHVNSALYGISPDFLIYQLDNCSAQIMAYQKHLVLLHKELAQLQKEHPEVDVSYSPTMKPYKSFYPQSSQLSQSGNLRLLSAASEQSFSQGLSNSSTPVKFSPQKSLEMMKTKVEIQSPYSKFSPTRSPRKDLLNALKAGESVYPAVKAERVTYTKSKSPVSKGGAAKRNTPEKLSPLMQAAAMFQKSKSSPEPRAEDVKPRSSQAVANTYIPKQKTAPNSKAVEISDVDSNASGYLLFEALRDSIYSEAATLISQNEARPHFLIELFHELQQLNSDYLRQHCLFVIRDVVNGYLVETPKQRKKLEKASESPTKVNRGTSAAYSDLMYDMKGIYSENTPSESEASESENIQIVVGANGNLLRYDYALDVSSASELTTPMDANEQTVTEDDSQNPFEEDFLGSTVIHLDEALQRVREIERLKQEKNDARKQVDQELVTPKAQINDSNATQVDAQRLDALIKQVISKVIPKIKSRDEVCTADKIKELCQFVREVVTAEHVPDCDGDKDSNTEFASQLESVLNQCLSKFLGYHFSECGEELVIDISEVLFNELACLYMVADGQEGKECFPKTVVEIVAEEELDEKSDKSESNDESDPEELEECKDEQSGSTRKHHQNTSSDGRNVVVDLSVSETKPLTSYGSGEDEEGGSGDEYDEYNEVDVPTSMQHDEACPSSSETSPREEPIKQDAPNKP